MQTRVRRCQTALVLTLLFGWSRPARAFVGFDAVGMAQMSMQLAELLSVLREVLANARATVDATRTSAQLAQESMRAVSDFDDYLEAPNHLFGFRAEDFGERLRAVRAEASAIYAATDTGVERGPGGLHDPTFRGPLHAISARLGAAHDQAIAQLHKHANYAQQAGDRLLDQLQHRGIDALTAVRSQARSAMQGAVVAVESALSLAQIERRQDVQQALMLEDRAMQLEARTRELVGMGLATGRSVHAAATAWSSPRQRGGNSDARR